MHTILVVDDERSMREFLSSMLEKEGYRVIVFEKGNEAIKFIRKNNYDLIITDRKMPKVNGIEILKKSITLHPNTPVIMVTAFASTEVAVEAMKLGAYDYITKPFNVDEIKIIIKKAIEKKTLFAENISQPKRRLNTMKSNCTISFYRNDLQRTRLGKDKCPVKNCKVDIKKYKVPFQKYKGKMRKVPFCPEHGMRIHNDGFIYYNGSSPDDLKVATKRNLMFNKNYYVDNFFKNGNKMESGRLCYESSEDAVSYNVFTELLSNGDALKKVVSHIAKQDIKDNVDLYLWGGKIDLKNNSFIKYEPLIDVRCDLESDIKRFTTEPDIILVVPKKILICIEAKFGSKNPIAKEQKEREGEKPKSKNELYKRYCENNKIIDTYEIFVDFRNSPKPFYEQLFRNIVFAASMAKKEGIADWYVVNLRSQHVMNLKRGKPESMPIKRDIHSILKPDYKKRFTHLTWEDIYKYVVEGDYNLANLAWYLKNKSLNCGRAFNIL